MWMMVDLEDADYAFMREAYRALHKDGLNATFPEMEAQETAAVNNHNCAVSDAWTTSPHLFRKLLLAVATREASTIVPVRLQAGTEERQVVAWRDAFVDSTANEPPAPTPRFRVRCHGNATGTEFQEYVLPWLSDSTATCPKLLARTLWQLVTGGGGPVLLPDSSCIQLRWSIDDERKLLPPLRILLVIHLTPVERNKQQLVQFDEETSHIVTVIAATSSDEAMPLLP
jgi:hypothetical protein